MSKDIPQVLSSQPDAMQLPPEWNYEATVAQVETIISQIEVGKLELAEVFDQFADAIEYLHQCEQFLAERRQQMDLLIETIADEPQF
ncbi:MAG: exodeoxyribonuclease VII small subunit [Hormoscilla sp. SP5CHS1]|nr:exodeoxyribonuclease VII small subunit [Hormoscilla sp. SP12CHS1]MBC6453205.1 exodeoxyribonuclease VII small subunit [Hormoscilla sp. SP5CHS1]